MLYPQNGDRIVALNSVTSLYPMYSAICRTRINRRRITLLTDQFRPRRSADGRWSSSLSSGQVEVALVQDWRLSGRLSHTPWYIYQWHRKWRRVPVGAYRRVAVLLSRAVYAYIKLRRLDREMFCKKSRESMDSGLSGDELRFINGSQNESYNSYIVITISYDNMIHNQGLWNTNICRNDLHFYRAMLCIRGTSLCLSVCLSVCLPVCVCHSQVGVLLKRLNTRSHKQHPRTLVF